MNIDVIFYKDRLFDNLLNNSTVIVVDVLRCTTSIVTAVMNGAEKVIPAKEPGDAAAYASRIGGCDCVVGGERGGVMLPGFNMGNSPFEYAGRSVKNKTVIVSTTNGTQAICGVRSAKRVFLGSFINCTAVAKMVAGYRDNILIVCAGTDGQLSADDLCTAGGIINRLRRFMDDFELSDIAIIAEHLYNSWESGTFDITKTLHYSRLERLGFEDDLKYCFQQDITDCVPVYENGIITAG